MELPNVPIEAASAYITDLTAWLHKALGEIRYGEVGLRFTVSDSWVVGYEAIYSPTIRAGKLRVGT